jgi:hypothetical protein
VVRDDNYEDTGDILFGCPLCIQVWRSIGLWEKVEATVKSTTTVQLLFFCCYNNLMSNKWHTWLHFYGVYGSIEIDSFGMMYQRRVLKLWREQLS